VGLRTANGLNGMDRVSPLPLLQIQLEIVNTDCSMENEQTVVSSPHSAGQLTSKSWSEQVDRTQSRFTSRLSLTPESFTASFRKYHSSYNFVTFPFYFTFRWGVTRGKICPKWKLEHLAKKKRKKPIIYRFAKILITWEKTLANGATLKLILYGIRRTITPLGSAVGHRFLKSGRGGKNFIIALPSRQFSNQPSIHRGGVDDAYIQMRSVIKYIDVTRRQSLRFEHQS